MCVKVVLAEDAEPMRKAIRVLLSEHEDITLVGEAATFSEAVQMAEELSPDVIVLDLHMADGAKQHLPDGTKLLTGCADKQARLWNLATGANERQRTNDEVAPACERAGKIRA